jgi:hypothetical protein
VAERTTPSLGVMCAVVFVSNLDLSHRSPVFKKLPETKKSVPIPSVFKKMAKFGKKMVKISRNTFE